MSLYGMREIEKRLEAEQRGELASLRAEVERLTAERDAIERATIERCAEVCDEMFSPAFAEVEHYAATVCAAAIRALKDER